MVLPLTRVLTGNQRMAGGELTLPLILSLLNPDPKPLARHRFPRLRRCQCFQSQHCCNGPNTRTGTSTMVLPLTRVLTGNQRMAGGGFTLPLILSLLNPDPNSWPATYFLAYA